MARPDPTPGYATLTSGYIVALAAVAVGARGRADAERAALRQELPALALATFGLSRVIVHDRVASWLRRPFVEREGLPDRGPRSGRVRRVVGELLTCTRCAGAWGALSLIGLRLLAPSAGRVVTAVFAASGANTLLQAVFALAARRADERRPPT